MWAEDKDRLGWHVIVDEEKRKCDQDPKYCPSAEFMSKSSKFGPTELNVAAPWRSGMLYYYTSPCE